MKDVPFSRAVLITLGVLVIATAYVQAASLLGLRDPWIAFLALTIWGALGMRLEQAPGIFLGGAGGLLLAWSMQGLPAMLGGWALALPLVAVILAIACHIKGWVPLLCNFGLFLFLAVGMSDLVAEQGLQISFLDDLAFGALAFWVLPWLVVKARAARA